MTQTLMRAGTDVKYGFWCVLQSHMCIMDTDANNLHICELKALIVWIICTDLNYEYLQDLHVFKLAYWLWLRVVMVGTALVYGQVKFD
jgi:hypothetical protein